MDKEKMENKLKNEIETEETEEIIEKTEIVKTLIHKFKREGKIMTLTARTVEQLDANDFENHLGETPRTTDLHPDELDLLYAYRVMNELGKSALIKVALDFAKTKTMRNKCIRSI